jgi:nucleotide-binding universal stress UspA family protein
MLHALQSTPHLPGEAVPAEQQNADYESQRARVMSLAHSANVDVGDVIFAERPTLDGIVQLAARIHPAVLVMGVAARERRQMGAVSTASQVLDQTDCDLLVVKPAGFVSPALVNDRS